MRTNCKLNKLTLLNFFTSFSSLHHSAPPSATLSGLCSECICFYVWQQACTVTGSLQEIYKSCCQLRAVAPGQEMEFFGTEVSEAEWEDWLKLFPPLKLNPTMPDSQHWHTGSMERNRSVHLREQNGADFPKHLRQCNQSFSLRCYTFCLVRFIWKLKQLNLKKKTFRKHGSTSTEHWGPYPKWLNAQKRSYLNEWMYTLSMSSCHSIHLTFKY